MSDGPEGVRTWGPTTAWPGGAALAATWDPALARKIGEGLGRDARARSVNFLLGPGVNIARSPLAGRNFEYFSEDPFLAASMTVPWIEGVQSQGVIATVKHYALNNQEYDRHNVSSDADERTMREIYLPAFEAAVTQAHVDAVMNSYNLINDVHATQNEFLNLKVLKGDWDFRGILMSDWDATYDTVGAANNGLDLEMPSPRFMNARGLLAAVKDGSVKESTIDDKVLRLIRLVLRYGFLDRPQFDPADATYSVADRAVALEGARESVTLLKNEESLLPLNAARIKTIAVIGPNAYPAVTGGGGSSEAHAFEPVSILTGIANAAGPDVSVLFSRGLPDTNELFRNTQWDCRRQCGYLSQQKLYRHARNNHPAKYRRLEARYVGPGRHNPSQHSLSTAFRAAKAGKYLLLAAASSEDSYKVVIDGNVVLEQPHAEGQSPRFKSLDLEAGQSVKIVAKYLPYSPGVRFGLGVAFEPDMVSAEAKTIAAAADVAGCGRRLWSSNGERGTRPHLRTALGSGCAD